jgi:hypothetical protein
VSDAVQVVRRQNVARAESAILKSVLELHWLVLTTILACFAHARTS